LGAAVSFAISAAIDEIENSQNDENIFYISDYVGRKTLRDTESVLRAFVEKVEDLL
jgi:hypothetical protein